MTHLERTDSETPAVQRMQATEKRLQTLLLQGMAGDTVAYNAFLKGLAVFLRAFLRRRLASLPDDIEDLVQDTLLAIHNQRHTYNPQQPLTAWVQAIARYKWVDLLRRRSGHEALNQPLEDDMALFAADDTAAADARHDLLYLLNRLPTAQREAIMATKLDGLSVAEAASAQGVSESALKVAVHRGLKALTALVSGAPRTYKE